MTRPSSSLERLAAAAALAAFVVGAAIGCGASDPPARPGVPDASTPTTLPPITTGGTDASGGAGGGGGIIVGDAQVPDGGPCVPARCDPPGGRYCGIVGDNCGGQIDCQTCPGD